MKLGRLIVGSLALLFSAGALAYPITYALFSPGNVNGWNLSANEPLLVATIPAPGEDPLPNGSFRVELGVSPQSGAGHVYVLAGKMTAFHQVPEPSTLTLLGLGLTGTLLTRRRRKN